MLGRSKNHQAWLDAKQAWDDELNKYFKGVGTPFEEPVKDEASFRNLDELRDTEAAAWERFCQEPPPAHPGQ
jgi:hypothetical protein